MMDVSEAFSWRGGGDLVVELSVEKGRPATLSEVVEALERFRWTASVAEAIVGYGAWTIKRDPDELRFASFEAWLSKLPDPQSLPAKWSELDALINPSDPFAQYFDQDTIRSKLAQLVARPAQSSGTDLIGNLDDQLLWLQLLAAAYENPTRSWIRVSGPLVALGVAAGIWGAVAYAKETNAHDLPRSGASRLRPPIGTDKATGATSGEHVRFRTAPKRCHQSGIRRVGGLHTRIAGHPIYRRQN